MRELEAGQCPKWRDVSEWGPIYKSLWAQWKSLAVRDSVLERHWESADGKKEMAQRVVPRNKVKKYSQRCMEAHRGDIWN
jgi:hypothetical protein